MNAYCLLITKTEAKLHRDTTMSLNEMVTLINHLPVSQEQKLRNAVSNVANEVALEKVICYGTRTKLVHTWSSFSAMLDSSMDTDYDLLFITKPEEKHRSHEILDIIDHHSTNDTRLVAIVHSQRAVSEALENGRFFSPLYAVMVF